MKPILDRHNVRFIGVGVEELGVEEFVSGKFFDGGKQHSLSAACYRPGGLFGSVFWASILNRRIEKRCFGGGNT